MTFFADLATALNSPTVSNSKDLFHYFFTNAGKEEMLSFYIFIAIGCVAALVAERVASSVTRKALNKFSPEIAGKVASAIRTPLCLLVFSYFFLIGFDAIKGMPSNIWMHVHENLYPIFNGLLVLVCAFRLVDLIAQVLRERWKSETAHLDERWADLIGLLGKSIVVLGAGLFIIQKIDPSFNIVPLVAGMSFVGAAVALASQKTIANAIGSLEIMVDKLFKEGDRISFGEYDGFVSRMGLRSVTLTSLTGERINLPNKDLVDKQIRNYTKGRLMVASLTVGVLYDYDRVKIEKAMALMAEVARADARIDKESVGTRFSNFGNSAIELTIFFLADYKTGGEYGSLMSDLRLILKETFDKAGIEFAFPTQTLYLKKEEPGDESAPER